MSYRRLLATAAATAVTAGLIATAGPASAQPARTQTFPVTATIPVGAAAVAVAVDPRTERAYVTTTAGMAVINERNNKVIATVPLPGAYKRVAVDVRTDRIYVTTTAGLAVIDGTHDQVVATVPIAGAAAVAVDKRLKRVYVTDPSVGTVIVLDAKTTEVVATVTIPSSEPGNIPLPEGIAVDEATHTVYVAVENESAVAIISGTTDTLTAMVGAGWLSTGLAVDPTLGHVYLSGESDWPDLSSLQIFNLAGTAIGQGPQEGNGGGVTVDPVTHLVYQASNIGLLVYDQSGALLANPTSGVPRPNGVAVDRKTGAVYVANANGTVVVVTPTPRRLKD